MGYGRFSEKSYTTTLASRGVTVDLFESGILRKEEIFTSSQLHPSLDPKGVIRECCDTEEHPETKPVALEYDVTGSMGEAAKKVAQSTNEIMQDLYEEIEDVEFLISATGDMAANDRTPFQASQFESDARIVDNIFNVYFEGHGGGNAYETYTALWYFMLNHTRLDCHKRGKKGLIITMGDEPLNPYLPAGKIREVFGDRVQGDINTDELYAEVIKLFDVWHIAVDDDSTCYDFYSDRIQNTWGKLLGENLVVSTLNELPKTIANIVKKHVKTQYSKTENVENNDNSGGLEVGPEGIRW